MSGVTTALFAAALERQFPSPHPEGIVPLSSPTVGTRSARGAGTRHPVPAPGPPAMAEPSLGQRVPIGEECPGCGQARLWWIYNPFMKRSVNGWVQYREPICACPGSDPYRQLAERTQGAAPVYDQGWLDREFGQRQERGQTLLSFMVAPRSPLGPLWQGVNRYAREYRQGQRGLYLAGPPSIGKGHLVSGLVNAARGIGATGLSVTASRLLDLSLPERGEPEETQAARQRRRRALRAVTVLAVRDLFRQPLRPTEVKELDLLLEYREERGLTTHFTSPFTPDQRRVSPGNTDARAALVRRSERMVVEVLAAPPRTAPFTERMARAAASGTREG